MLGGAGGGREWEDRRERCTLGRLGTEMQERLHTMRLFLMFFFLVCEVLTWSPSTTITKN